MSDYRRFFLLLLILLGTWMTSACETTTYIFRPPVTDQGRFCVTQCAAIRETCNGNEIQRAEREKSSCERSSDTAFYICMAQHLPPDAEKDKAKNCEKQRRSCWSSPNTGRCDSDYRDCFVNCGGEIEKHVE